MAFPSRSCRAALLGAALVLSIPCSEAQDAPKSAVLDPLVITASRSPQLLTDLIADVTWIGPDEIARAGAFTSSLRLCSISAMRNKAVMMASDWSRPPMA